MKNFILQADLNNKNVIDDSVNIKDDVIINIKGENNIVTISKKVELRNISVLINGNNNNLFIDEFCNLRGALHLRQDSSLINIGKKTTFVGANLFAMEGRRIIIGEDCMFSSGIFLRTSDEHSIIELNNNSRINYAKDILVGNHVWLGEGVTLSKGSSVPDDCIVGARSVVTKVFSKSNAIYAGCPARIIKDGITWDREII